MYYLEILVGVVQTLFDYASWMQCFEYLHACHLLVRAERERERERERARERERVCVCVCERTDRDRDRDRQREADRHDTGFRGRRARKKR